jgi:hypothetical protein
MCHHSPFPLFTPAVVLGFTSFLVTDVSLFDTFAPLLSKRIIAQSRGLKEEHDFLHTLLRGRGGRFDQPGFCSYQ